MLKRITLCTIQIGDIMSLYQLGTVDLKWQSNFVKLFKDTYNLLSQTITPLKSEMKARLQQRWRAEHSICATQEAYQCLHRKWRIIW